MKGRRGWKARAGLLALFAIAAAGPGGARGEADTTYANSVGMEFVRIEPGTFTMGSPLGEPGRDVTEAAHTVHITRPFYLQTTEVTLGQWREVMGKSFFLRRPGPDQLPVVRVSWYDAMEFIQKLNKRGEGVYRLPTEAEWEYAARAGATTAFHWGDQGDCSRALFSNNRDRSPKCIDQIRARGFAVDSPAPVGSYPPNAWGLFDMHGNVWEWCSDWYGPYSTRAQTDPMGPRRGTEKVRRGGSWYLHASSIRSANRALGHPATRYKTTGFRLVREAAEDAVPPPPVWPPLEDVPSK